MVTASTQLDLHGQPLFVDATGQGVKFAVQRTAVPPDRSHGLSYSLTLPAPVGTRLVGFDTTGSTVRPTAYTDAAT